MSDNPNIVGALKIKDLFLDVTYVGSDLDKAVRAAIKEGAYVFQMAHGPITMNVLYVPSQQSHLILNEKIVFGVVTEQANVGESAAEETVDRWVAGTGGSGQNDPGNEAGGDAARPASGTRS